MKKQMHFAHGNGFPSPCYHQMLQSLAQHFDYTYIDKVGHTRLFPVTDNWHHLVDEVIASIEAQASTPVIAVGHSLGGVLSFRAAVLKPALFKAVILLDAPIIGRFKSNLLRLSKTIGMIDHITPAFQTRGRRTRWQSKSEVLKYLKRRSLFKYFTEACLEDYIEYGMRKEEDGYVLRFDPNIEYQIYRTIPHRLYEFEGRLTCPAALIYGSKSNVIDRMDLRYMKKQYQIKTYKTEGTHMFPMEHPEKAAALIIQAVDALS